MNFKNILLLLFLLIVTCSIANAQQENEKPCVDTLHVTHLLQKKFRLDTIVFTKKKYEVPGKPYEWVTFDSTTITFTKADGNSYSGTYYIYQNRIFFEVNPNEKGCFAVSCYNTVEMTAGVYYHDLNSNSLKSAQRTFVFDAVSSD